MGGRGTTDGTQPGVILGLQRPDEVLTEHVLIAIETVVVFQEKPTRCRLGVERGAVAPLEDGARLLRRHRAAHAHVLLEVAAVEELGDLEGTPVVGEVAEVVDAERVRVLEAREREELL